MLAKNILYSFGFQGPYLISDEDEKASNWKAHLIQ